MGSSSVMHLVNDDDLHVAYDVEYAVFWAVGKEGSYGCSAKRETAIQIAADAAGGTRPIKVHSTRVSARVLFRILKVKCHKPSSQFFQDAVP